MRLSERASRRLFSLELAGLVAPTIGLFVVMSCALTFWFSAVVARSISALVAGDRLSSVSPWDVALVSVAWLLGVLLWIGLCRLAPLAARFHLSGARSPRDALLVGAVCIALPLAVLGACLIREGALPLWGGYGSFVSALLAFYASGASLFAPLAHLWIETFRR